MQELRTPLEIALQQRDKTAIRARLAQGDAPEQPNHLGIPALFDGLRSNDLDILAMLDDAGADWDTPYNDQGYTALIYACLHCELKTVAWLLDRGQSVQQRTALGVTVMHVAVQRDSEEVARYLYRHGACPFGATRHGEFPLLVSLKAKRGLTTTRFLLRCYKEHDKTLDGETMACIACIVEKQHAHAVDALRALLPFAGSLPTEAELTEYMRTPGQYSSMPFRTLEQTLQSRLTATLFALLDAERISRRYSTPKAGFTAWRGYEGL